MVRNIDQHVGRRIRQARALRGLSMEKLAQALGISYQQLQKYEVGSNRVSCGRLWLIGQTLDLPIGFFFDGLENEGLAAGGDDALVSRRTINAARQLEEIEDPALRDQLVAMIRTCARSGHVVS
ncbi:helix-turn-helix domain-containing protein [Algihabitans albus]|uniref:helix-turn-helix domain-containing protein n=1 Tax=Algihabitans albus TaxID=2164067 RepID=UPI000E5D871F|nr:helix-turn-helix transcriptional regulator [Algihabitans albus]